jgi:hypothetical protein
MSEEDIDILRILKQLQNKIINDTILSRRETQERMIKEMEVLVKEISNTRVMANNMTDQIFERIMNNVLATDVKPQEEVKQEKKRRFNPFKSKCSFSQLFTLDFMLFSEEKRKDQVF